MVQHCTANKTQGALDFPLTQWEISKWGHNSCLCISVNAVSTTSYVCISACTMKKSEAIGMNNKASPNCIFRTLASLFLYLKLD